MLHSQDIVRIISAHAVWLDRLKSAIESGASDVTPDQVSVDDRCDFGRWLYAIPALERAEEWRVVREIHASFHREAAEVLREAVPGRREEARRRLDKSGALMKTSTQLVFVLFSWQRNLAAAGK